MDDRTWNHVRLHVQLFKDKRLGGNEIALYAALAVHVELATGQARPSKKTLGDYLNFSEKTVYTSIVKLEQAGYIKVDHRPSRASVYHLLPPPPLPAIVENVEENEAREDGDQGDVTDDTSSPVNITRLNRHPDSEETDPNQVNITGLNDRTRKYLPVDVVNITDELEPIEQEDTLESENFSKISTLFPTQPLLPAAENELRRREFWKTFIEVCGKPGTPIENKQWNNIAKMFAADPDISPESFKVAHAAAKRTWGTNMAKTPTAIAKNWSTLYSAPGAEKPRNKDTEAWMRRKLNWTPQSHPSHPEESA